MKTSFLAVFVFLYAGATNAALDIDGDELKSLLDKYMEPTVTALKSEINELKYKYESVVSELKTIKDERISKRTKANSQQDKPAFYVYSSYNQYMNPGPTQAVRFDHITTNNSAAFNTGTGQFTCRVPGTYVFSWTAYILQGDVPTDLMLNGVRACSTGTQFQATNLCVLDLNRGDEVYIRASPCGNSRGAVWSWSSFSGFYLN